MDRQRLSHLAHADHPIAAPLSDDRVDGLLRAALDGRERVLDLGCGSGEWLLRALQVAPGIRAIGVDLSGQGFSQTRSRATALGVADRLELVIGDAADHPGPPADLVVCIGASHAFGGFDPMMTALEHHCTPGGRLLVGDGFWEQEPGDQVLTLLGQQREDFRSLADTVGAVRDRGWVPLTGHVSSLPEWDDYEWAWTGTLSRWALENPTDPDSEAALRVADDHRDTWLRGYRRMLGFVTLLLGRSEAEEN